MGDWFTENAPPTPDEAQILAQIRAREAGGDYSARNPKPGSTASGAYQFTSSPVSPTWQLATKATGVPAYPSAAKAPPAIQDANALYMLRKHGPNATITWAASGPYPEAGNGGGAAPAGQVAAGDVLSRLATGDVTPDELAQYLQPQQAAPRAAAAVQPPAPAGPVQSGDWFAQNAPPPKPPPPPSPSTLDEVKRLGSIAAGASGLTTAKDILANGAKTAMDFLVGNTPDPKAIEQFNTSLLGLEHGIYGELPRSGQQLVESLKAFGRGDINSAADHLWFSIPFLGAAGQQMKDYLDRGDVKGALAHAAGSLAPVAAHPTISATRGAIEALPETIKALPETVSRTAEATRTGVRAAAPDVGMGTAKVGVGVGAHYLPIPGEVKYGIGIPTVGAGAKQIVGGLKKGVAAARASFAETAPAVAPEAPGAGFAVPKEPPITGPTDEALVHLYSVETDPVKRAALQSQLVDRGLIKAEPSTTPLEANPYRGYSQDALRKVYAIEPEAAKRALIEQAARDRGLSLLSREGRRATAAVPETGAVEARGPSLTQDDALMLRYLGETDPLAADAETIGIARKLAVDNPELLRRLRAGETEPIVAPPTPAEKTMTAQPAVQSVPAAMEYNAPSITPAQQRIVEGAQQAGEFTPEEQARANAILENVDPQAAPATAAAAAPAAPQPQSAVPAKSAPAAVETPLSWARAEIVDRGQLPAVSEIQRRFKMGYGAATNVLREAQGLRPEVPIAAPAAPAAPATAPKPTSAEALKQQLRAEMEKSGTIAPGEALAPDVAEPDVAAVAREAETAPTPLKQEIVNSANYARYLRKQGWTAADAQKMTAAERETLAKGFGNEAPSDAAWERTLFQMRRVEKSGYEYGVPVTKTTTPAEATAKFEQIRKGPATAPTPATDLETQLADSLAGKRTAPPPEGPRAPGAAEKRVEAFAQHLAADTENITPKTLDDLPKSTNALLQLEALGKRLGIKGRPAPGEVQQIVDRVRQLRGEGAARKAQWHHGSEKIFQELDPEFSHPGSEHGKVTYITDNPKEAAKYGTVRSVEFTGEIFPEGSALDLNLIKRVTQQLSKDNPKQAPSITASLESAKTRGIKTNDIALQEIRRVLPGDFVAQQQAINNALKKLGYSARAYTEESGAKTLAVFDKQALRAR